MLNIARKLLSPPPEGYFCMPLRIAIIAGLAALLWAALTSAQTMTCRSSEVCLSWEAPVNNTDGTLITADQKPLIYRVYRQTETGFVLITNTAGLAIKLVGEPRGEQCYALTAMDAKAAESSRTGVVCKTVRFPGPTEGTIERPTDGGIE